MEKQPACGIKAKIATVAVAIFAFALICPINN
jgi:hypothetical protein